MLQKHLYSNNTVSEVLESYIRELSSSGKTDDFNHANKLRSYQHTIADTDFLDELHGLFIETYRLLVKSNPELNFNVDGRQKSLVSTECKILRYQSLGKSLDLINDILAFRIIFWEKTLGIDLIPYCYTITEQIIDFFASKGFMACQSAPLIGADEQNPENQFHQTFKYKDVIKDYVCFPKEEKKIKDDKKQNSKKNQPKDKDGKLDTRYRSIHLVLVNPDGKKFEMQIRTSEMDAIADEYDHELYKSIVNQGIDLTLDREKISIPGYHNERKDFVGLEKAKSIFPR